MKKEFQNTLQRQSKKCTYGPYTGRPGHRKHRPNKCTYLYPTNNGNTISILQAIKNKVAYESDPSGNVINLWKHSLSSDTFTLLNKNLDSVPTTKKYKKKQLYTDAENFFCLIKQWVHFQDIDPQSNTDQQNLLFQIKNKQKWTLKHTHHNLRTFIDLVKNDIKTKKKRKKERNEKPKTQSIQRWTKQ